MWSFPVSEEKMKWELFASCQPFCPDSLQGFHAVKHGRLPTWLNIIGHRQQSFPSATRYDSKICIRCEGTKFKDRKATE